MILNAVPGETHYLAWQMFCKTTGEVESHIGICLLLRTLSKYMSGLKVSDYTDFYKTGNLKKLYQEHMVMGTMIGLLKRPGTLGLLLKAASLPDLSADAKIVPLDSIHVPPKPEKPKKKTRVM